MALPLAGPAAAGTLEVYGRLPAIEDVQISPDGSMLAVAVTDGETRRLVFRKVADRTPVALLNLGDDKLRDVQWAGPGHVLITVSATAQVWGLEGPKREYYMMTAFDLATRKQTLMLGRAQDAMNVVVAPAQTRIIGGAPVAFLQGVHFVDHVGQTALYAANLKTGDTRRIDPVSGDADDWVIDADGAPLAQSAYDQKTGVWTLRARTAKGWAVIDRAAAPMGAIHLPGLGRERRSILAQVRDDERLVLREYAADGAKTTLPPDLSADAPIHDPASHVLIGGVTLVGDDLRYRFFDPRVDALWQAVARAFPGDQVSLASWSDDRRKVVVRVESPTLGPAYALADLDRKSADWLGNVYAGLSAADVFEVRPVSYKARDGLEITGYLTLPKGKTAKDLPLVVLPHGGPADRDKPGFDWWAQALASRGYAVLQPNFRGSDGFGWAFMAAGFGQWGRKMQTDLSDGVRHLAAQGLIDPKRVCIVGASYGGYAALAGATLDPGVYRCAAAVAGVADLRRFLQSGQKLYQTRDNARLRYWTRFMGVDGVKDPDLAAISPARLADRVSVPVLLIHGKDDTVVPYEQSQIMAAALKKAGKPVELVTLAGEDHWLSRGATRLQMLTAVAAFLETNNPPN